MFSQNGLRTDQRLLLVLYGACTVGMYEGSNFHSTLSAHKGVRVAYINTIYNTKKGTVNKPPMFGDIIPHYSTVHMFIAFKNLTPQTSIFKLAKFNNHYTVPYLAVTWAL